MQRSVSGKLECRSGHLSEGRLVLDSQHRVRGRHHDIMSIIDTCVCCTDAMQCADHHFRMFVAREGGTGRDHAVIEIALVVENRAASRSPPNKHSRIFLGRGSPAVVVQRMKASFKPRVLIATDYHARLIDV